jgi:hypothetical protein
MNTGGTTMPIETVLADHVSVEEAAQRYGCTPRWLWEQIRRGNLEVLRPGARCTLVNLRSLEELIAARDAEAAK